MTPLERAKRDLTTASVVNSLYCMYSSTLGKDPQNEEDVGVESVSTIKLLVIGILASNKASKESSGRAGSTPIQKENQQEGCGSLY
jgi:hypothetical protein